jgi:tRNA (guanosine-2'-O-)-methyltransferase
VNTPFDPTGAADLLAPLLTEERRRRIRTVVERRTDRLILVAENLYDPHNLSALLRTADAFGLQYVHLAGDTPTGLKPDVALGAERWITVSHDPDAAACLERLRGRGRRIAATGDVPGAIAPADWTPDGPVALVLGNEHEGISPAVRDAADVVLCIPMLGFAQSFNVSVATALLIQTLLSKPALASRGLPASERRRLLDEWTVRSVPNGEVVLDEIRRREGAPRG